MQIIVVLLLALALALLVLGLISANSALVVGSILASLLAVALIVRARRGRIGQPAVAAAAQRSARPAERTALPRSATRVGRHAAIGRAENPGRASDQGPASDPTPAADPAPAEDPAAADPARAEDPAAEADDHAAEAELGTADGEDAEDDPPAADTAAPLSGHGQNLVWVIDGQPRYHLAGCDFLPGRPGQPIPLSQAVEDGFTPCSRCDPDNRLAASSRAATS
jgi:hypothetical protein